MSKPGAPRYNVRAADPLPGLGESWSSPAWAAAEFAEITHFRPEGSAHKPRTRARLLHGQGGIRGIYIVDDCYVRSLRAGFQSEVWKDSCVEFFVQPRGQGGYFNLEMNAGGSHLCFFIEDCARVADGFKKFTKLPEEIGGKIQVRSSLPGTVDPEITEPLTWELNFFVPFAVFEHYTGPLGAIRGQDWRCNFNKCGDELSHPHWGSWSPLDALNFHSPHCFGDLHFA